MAVKIRKGCSLWPRQNRTRGCGADGRPAVEHLPRDQTVGVGKPAGREPAGCPPEDSSQEMQKARFYSSFLHQGERGRPGGGYRTGVMSGGSTELRAGHKACTTMAGMDAVQLCSTATGSGENISKASCLHLMFIHPF